ncbi:MAG: hypothetical protein HPZ91_11215 [Lentisphaeria bacterium]|nr:hypothetical protein [Lentisphaeria bacterium]
MMKKLPLLLLLALCAAIPAGAASLPFRSGEILAAELSAAKPNIANEDPLAFPVAFNQKIYAALVVRVAAGRGISIHDYSLEAFGRSYPCIALRIGDGGFNAENWQVKRVDPNEKYTLLFVLDATRVGRTKDENHTLRAEFPPKENADLEVPFTNLGSRGFTAPRSVPRSGSMRVGRK